MTGPTPDPLLLGQRVVAILETGLRTATYKLATLMALIDHCIENLPEESSSSLVVPIPDLAHRVLKIYWRQIRPFEGHELRQSTHARCKGDKRNSLPAVEIVDRTLDRDQKALEAIAAELNWPTQRDRVIAAARGLYRGQPTGVPTWSGFHRAERLDVSYPPWWMRIGSDGFPHH